MPTDQSIAVPSSHAQDDDQSIAVMSSPTLPAVPKRRKKAIKPPKDSKVYKTAMAVVALRSQGMRGQEIADQLGMKYNTVKTYLQRAVQRGWLTYNSFTDPEDRVDYVLADKAIRNANELLDERDKDMTIETLKGTGIFKQHQAVKVDNTTNVGLALKVQVEMPTFNGPLPTVRVGSIGGAHGVQIPTDAEIVEEQS